MYEHNILVKLNAFKCDIKYNDAAIKNDRFDNHNGNISFIGDIVVN